MKRLQAVATFAACIITAPLLVSLAAIELIHAGRSAEFSIAVAMALALPSLYAAAVTLDSAGAPQTGKETK